jgi:hypothetical protein
MRCDLEVSVRGALVRVRAGKATSDVTRAASGGTDRLRGLAGSGHDESTRQSAARR